MRVAVIDIGSSSTKLIIGEKQGEEIKIIESLKNVIGIGKSTFYMERISQDIFNQVIDVLDKYKQVIGQYEVTNVKVIATTAVRESENRDIFIDTIQRKTGFAVDVLNVGDVVYYIDAFLSYKLKKAYPIHEKNVIIAELSSGSLDVSLMEKGFTLMNIGVPIGTLRLKQFKSRLDASKQETFEAVNEYVENQIFLLKKAFPNVVIDDIILIDESYASAIHSILPNKKRESNFFSFQFREAKRFLSRVMDRSFDELSSKHNIPVDVAEALDSYAVILSKLYTLIKHRSIFILETSLMEAVMANILFDVELSQKYNKSNQLVSVAKSICRKFGSDLKHSKQVAMLSEELFKAFRETLGLKQDDLLYLLLSAYLHNVGLFVNNRSQHKHTEYIINATNLFRLTEQEIKMIACIARYHRKVIPQKTHYIYGSLAPDQQILVQKLSSLLRMANALDSSHKQKVKKMEVKATGKQEFSLTVFSEQSFALEKVNFIDMKQFFEEVSGSKINLVVRKQAANA